MQTFGSGPTNISNIKGIIQAVAIIAVVVLLFYVVYSWNNSEDKPASETGKNIGEGIGSAAVGLASSIIKDIGKELEINTKNEGEDCNSHANCKGWAPGQPDKLACCNGKCTKLQRDWAGVGYCPDECKDAPAPLGGRCDRGYSWPRKVGEPCDTLFACTTGLCKNGVCGPDCPNGTNQTAATCWYDRGIGRIPNKQDCPSNMRDDGLSCWLDTYGRGAGYAAWDWDKCTRENSQGCEWNGAMIYPKCRSGYHNVGCCLCEPDGGPGIKKTLFQRHYCNDDEELRDGLCYKKPRDGFNCVATICSMNR